MEILLKLGSYLVIYIWRCILCCKTYWLNCDLFFENLWLNKRRTSYYLCLWFYIWYQSQDKVSWRIQTMGDVKDAIVLHKDTGPSGVKFPMLTSSNYTVWSMRMKIALKVCEVWEVIDPGTKDEKNLLNHLVEFVSRRWGIWLVLKMWVKIGSSLRGRMLE